MSNPKNGRQKSRLGRTGDWERVITKEDRTLEFLKDICAQKNINVLELVALLPLKNFAVDRDLAEMYDVKTKVLKQAVKRKRKL